MHLDCAHHTVNLRKTHNVCDRIQLFIEAQQTVTVLCSKYFTYFHSFNAPHNPMGWIIPICR